MDWVEIIKAMAILTTALTSLVAAAMAGVLAWQVAKAKIQMEAAAAAAAAKVEAVAAKAEDVKTTLDTTTTKTAIALTGLSQQVGEVKTEVGEVKKTGDTIHVLVNSSFSTQLRVAAVALRRVAELTNHETDREAANLAEAAYQKHEGRHNTLDIKEIGK